MVLCGCSSNSDDLSTKAKSKFSVLLRGLAEPMSLREIARTWDACARKVIAEYAQQAGGGSFSSSYGCWESCVGASEVYCIYYHYLLHYISIYVLSKRKKNSVEFVRDSNR